MSRAFTSEDDTDGSLNDIGERPVSEYRNLVTPAGLASIDAMLEELREALARAEADADRSRIATVSRDLRYWAARRETAEVSVPDPDNDVVRFGMTVTLKGDDDGREKTWTIVGEDEADAARGTISHASPMAAALFGKGIGDVVTVGGRDWEVAALG